MHLYILILISITTWTIDNLLLNCCSFETWNISKLKLAALNWNWSTHLNSSEVDGLDHGFDPSVPGEVDVGGESFEKFGLLTDGTEADHRLRSRGQHGAVAVLVPVDTDVGKEKDLRKKNFKYNLHFSKAIFN